MEKSKNFVSRKFTVDECNSNPNVHFNRCKKEPKPSVLAPLAPPGRFELPTFRLGGERYYPAELRRLIHDIQFFCNLWRAALLPLRRRSLYTTELQGRMESIGVASDACMASRIRGGLSALLSGHGGSAENIVPVFCPAVNGKGLPHRRQPSVAHWMTRTRITFSSAVTSSRTD